MCLLAIGLSHSYGIRFYLAHPRENGFSQRNVPKCLVLNLKTLVWKDYEWQENEKEVTKYILSNASRLEKATLFIKHLTSEERVAMVEELETVIKASSSCQLVFNNSNEHIYLESCF